MTCNGSFLLRPSQLNSLSQNLTVLPAPSGREPLARPQALHFSRKLYRYAKGPILEGAVERSETGGVSPGVRLLRLFCRGHPAPTSASPVLLCTSSSCPVRLESRAM